MTPVGYAGLTGVVLVFALAVAVHAAPAKAGRGRASLLPLGAAMALVSFLLGLTTIPAATPAAVLAEPWLWGPLLAALLALLPPAAEPEPAREVGELRHAATAVADAGKGLQNTLGPLQGAVDELRGTVARLDTDAASERMQATAEAFATKLSGAAEALVVAGNALGERQSATIAAFDTVAATAAEMTAHLGAITGEFGRLAEALAPAKEAADALREGLTSLTDGEAARAQTSEDLRALLERVQAAQEPLLDELRRAGGALTEAGGSLGHLVRGIKANEETVAKNLQEVYTRLNGAAERMETAVEQWGKLVRTGLASSHEFSRQAIEALLARLEQSPPDFATVAEAARETARASEQMAGRIDASLTAFARGIAELRGEMLAVGESARTDLTASVEALSGAEIKELGAQIAGLRKSLAGLLKSLGSPSAGQPGTVKR